MGGLCWCLARVAIVSAADAKGNVDGLVAVGIRNQRGESFPRSWFILQDSLVILKKFAINEVN